MEEQNMQSGADAPINNRRGNDKKMWLWVILGLIIIAGIFLYMLRGRNDLLRTQVLPTSMTSEECRVAYDATVTQINQVSNEMEAQQSVANSTYELVALHTAIIEEIDVTIEQLQNGVLQPQMVDLEHLYQQGDYGLSVPASADVESLQNLRFNVENYRSRDFESYQSALYELVVFTEQLEELNTEKQRLEACLNPSPAVEDETPSPEVIEDSSSEPVSESSESPTPDDTPSESSSAVSSSPSPSPSSSPTGSSAPQQSQPPSPTPTGS